MICGLLELSGPAGCHIERFRDWGKPDYQVPLVEAGEGGRERGCTPLDILSTFAASWTLYMA